MQSDDAHTHYDVRMRKPMRCMILALLLATTIAAIFKFAIFHKVNRRVSIIFVILHYVTKNPENFQLLFEQPRTNFQFLTKVPRNYAITNSLFFHVI